MTALLVALGGALGAPLRYLVDEWIGVRLRGPVPWGTLLVNLTGSALLGVVAGLVEETAAASWVVNFVGQGLCGALTTFSAVSFETVRLLQQRRHAAAVALLVVGLVSACGGAAAGWWLATSLA